MTNEDKKAAFMEKAKANKVNFELHIKLIEESIKPLQYHLGKESIKHFYETGSVSGGFFLALMEYAENYADTKVKNISSNSMLADEVCVHPFANVVISGTDICCFKCGKKLK